MSSPNAPSPAPDPHVCRRCTDRGPTCCRLLPGEEKVCFPLSESERDQILRVTGDAGAFASECNSEPFVDNVKRLFPVEKELADSLFPRDKTHLRLGTRADGSCVFLGDAGCVLPREARPYYCLVFPFWVTKGRLTLFTPPNCLAVEECRSLREMLRIFGMSEDEVRELYGKLRAAWGLPVPE